MLTLYYAPDTCALAPHIALEEAGADYSTVKVDFRTAEQQAPAFRAVNPKARVPALVTDRGVLTETPALLAYVAQRYPDADLAPLDDPFAFATLQAFNSYLCSTLHVAHAHRMRGERWVDAADTAAIEAMQRKVPESVGTCWRMVEESLFVGPWVLGERYSIADPYLFTLAQWMAGDGVDPADFPALSEHSRRMAERPAVQAALHQESR